VREACAFRDAPKYLIRDRDRVYGSTVCDQLKAFGIQEVLTAPASPWQNGYVERLIGSIRRECLDHFVILNARHLKRTLGSYFEYYHRSRTHLALRKDCPIPRAVLDDGKIVRIPYLGGLHHCYTRRAA
jgi:transposase InsO family protein